MKICYVVSKPGMTNMSCGVFTNKKSLFVAFLELKKKHDSTIMFYGVLNYETRIFNHANLNNLLNAINVGESFALKFISNGDEPSKIYEITVNTYNKLLQ